MKRAWMACDDEACLREQGRSRTRADGFRGGPQATLATNEAMRQLPDLYFRISTRLAAMRHMTSGLEAQTSSPLLLSTLQIGYAL